MDNVRVDIVVIGAGIGGLAAARDLSAKGFSIAVLEARDRIGGRLLSDSLFNLDLGATWFWPNEPRVTKLVSDLGVETFPQYTSGDALYETPDRVERIQGNPIGVYSNRFTHGAQSLAEAVAKVLPEGVIRLSEPVTQIISSDDEIQAVTESNVYLAQHVVLAIPPPLAVTTIDFTPKLPEKVFKLARITPVWMGAITKLVAIYEEAFWRRERLAGSAISYVGPMREVHDMSGPEGAPAALFGFAPPIKVNQPTFSKESLIEQLVLLFGPKAAEPRELYITDWRHEHYTSPPEVERLVTYEAFGHSAFVEPVMEGHLHWASTETATENPGHIEGALAAAARAVSFIVGKEN